jgi:RNA-directed DNA polymerase
MTLPLVSVSPNERSVDELAKTLDDDVQNLSTWLSSIPTGYDYEVFQIPKRNSGFRLIAAPNDSLSELQKRIYKTLLRDELIQSFVCGFVPGKSILDNARPHLNSQIVIKLDLKDFFHSIDEGRVFNFWKRDNWNSDAATILTRICCRNGSLPQGAPTSPALSNCVNQRFDALVYKLSDKYYFKYTRYADDLTFSARIQQKKAENRVRPFLDELRILLKDEHYRVQWRKGVKILRRHQRQIITGILVNDQLALPRETRDLIRALRHKQRLGLLDEYDLKRLQGYELLHNMVQKANVTRTPDHRSKNNLKGSSNFVQVVIDMSKKITNVSGDIVHGNQVKAGDNYGGIQTVGQNETQDLVLETKAGIETGAKKWTRGDKIAVIAFIVSTIVALLIGAVAFWQTELRKLFGYP